MRWRSRTRRARPSSSAPDDIGVAPEGKAENGKLMTRRARRSAPLVNHLEIPRRAAGALAGLSGSRFCSALASARMARRWSSSPGLDLDPGCRNRDREVH